MKATARAALVVAHPGHELRIHGWLEQARPRVHVLTDGSGRTGRSRLQGTESLLAACGCAPGCIFGRFTDGQFYSLLLDHDIDCFIDLAEQLARSLCEDSVGCVVADAREGYNPAHDVSRAVAETAVTLARVWSGHRIRCYDFPLIGAPDACPPEREPRALRLQLGPEAFGRKLAAARAFPELAGELTAAIETSGLEAFHVECLRPVHPRAGGSAPPGEPPHYERYGERQHAAGHYAQVLRYREHVAPLERALRRHVLGSAQWKRCRS